MHDPSLAGKKECEALFKMYAILLVRQQPCPGMSPRAHVAAYRANVYGDRATTKEVVSARAACAAARGLC